MARAIGRVLEQTYAEWQELKEKRADAERFDDPLREELRQVLYGQESPCVMTVEESRDFYRILEHDKIRSLQGAFEEVFFDHVAVAPPRALVLGDRPKLYDPYVFVRGDPKNKGQKVPRRFLQMMSSIDGGQPFKKGSGRLELAQAIVHPKNTLTARVIVNRIWGWHFGRAYKLSSSNGSQFDPEERDEMYRQYIIKASFSDVKTCKLTEAPQGKLIWLGGPDKLAQRDYLGVPRVTQVAH